MNAADFEEDTLLPPPAPGMEAPSHAPPADAAAEHTAIPEHVTESASAHRVEAAAAGPASALGVTTDPLASVSGDTVAHVLSELPVDRTQRMPLFVPSRLRSDETPGEQLPLDQLAVEHTLGYIDPNATAELPPVSRKKTVRFPAMLPHTTSPLPTVSAGETQRLAPLPSQLTMRFPAVAPPLAQAADLAVTSPLPESPPIEDTAEIARADLFAAATVEMPVVLPLPDQESPSHAALSQATRSMPKISVPPPSEDTLPPLPLLAVSDTVPGRLGYAMSGLRSLWRRRRQEARLRRELGERLSAYDRALVSLGELAYAEHIELIAHMPDLDVETSGELPVRRDAVQLRVQQASERFWAKAQKDQRALARKEALLSSELRGLHQRRDELYQRLLILAGDLRTSSSGASSDERYAVGMELAGIDGETHKIAARLGEARADLRLLRRQNQHVKTRRDQLVYALSVDLADAARRAPHLLLLGVLTAVFRPQPASNREKRARFDSLYALLGGLRGGIAKVETRLALQSVSRRQTEQKALRKVLLWLGGLAVLGLMALLLLVFYLLSA
jgi:hypothetical protein